MSLYQEMLENGLVLGSRYSDLYVLACHKSREVIKKHKAHAVPFVDQINGDSCYDIAFANDIYWDNIQAQCDKRRGKK